jgi:hypothetical protein
MMDHDDCIFSQRNAKAVTLRTQNLKVNENVSLL